MWHSFAFLFDVSSGMSTNKAIAFGGNGGFKNDFEAFMDLMPWLDGQKL